MKNAQLRYLKRLECTFDRLELSLICRAATDRRTGFINGATNAAWQSGAYLAIDLLSRRDVRNLAARLLRRALHRRQGPPAGELTDSSD